MITFDEYRTKHCGNSNSDDMDALEPYIRALEEYRNWTIGVGGNWGIEKMDTDGLACQKKLLELGVWIDNATRTTQQELAQINKRFEDAKKTTLSNFKDKLFLLSDRDTIELREEVLRVWDSKLGDWWLRTPGNGEKNALSIWARDGGVNNNGWFVGCRKNFFARPALMIAKKNVEIEKDVATFGGKKWYVIKEEGDKITLLLRQDSMTRELLTMFDTISNDYETSYIRQFLKKLAVKWFTKEELDLIIDWEGDIDER